MVKYYFICPDDNGKSTMNEDVSVSIEDGDFQFVMLVNSGVYIPQQLADCPRHSFLKKLKLSDIGIIYKPGDSI